jgi:alcohol dehydrogenase (cytochrome c)
VAPHARRLGLQPARPDRSQQREPHEDGLGARHGHRHRGSHPACLRRRHVLPGPGDVIQAINAKTGDLAWEYKRKLPEGVNGGTNRNIAIWGSTLIDGSADNQIYAVDVHTGNLVWETAVMEAKKRARSSAGPIIANGKVITGRQCQPDAGNDACIITAHDAKTGKEVWRTRTIPLPGEPGYETWGDVPMAERWHVGTVDGAELRPGVEPDFRGTSVTIPGAKVHAGRQRQDLPVPQLRRWP